MTRRCESCGTPFDAKRSSARFCSLRCIKRAQRARVPDAVTPALAVVPSIWSLLAATTDELRRADRFDSASGQAALLLAARIDGPTADTGASIAALVREYRATLAEALRGAVSKDDPVELLRAELVKRRGLHSV